MSTLTFDSPVHGAIHNFTKVRQARIRNAERRGREPQGRPFVTRGFNMVHPAIAAAAAGVAALLKPKVIVASPVAPTATKVTPPPSASSDAFKALMVGIVNAPKQVTKTDLIGYAGTYGVKVVKSWTKDKILSTLAEACGLTYTP